MLDAHDPTGCCGQPAGRGEWAWAPGGYAVRFALNEIGLVPRESSHTRPKTLTLRSRSRYQRSNRLWHYTSALLYLFIVYMPSGGTDGHIISAGICIRCYFFRRTVVNSIRLGKTVFGAIQ